MEGDVLYRVAEIFASLRDVDATLAGFLELAREISGGQVGSIYIRDDARGRFMRWREHGQGPPLEAPIDFCEALFRSTRSLAVRLDDPIFASIDGAQRAIASGLRGGLLLGLLHESALIGILALCFPERPELPDETLRTLTALARFPAAAIAHARTREEAERRARLADALRRFGERALTTVDSEALQRLILDTTCELTGADQASITRVQRGRLRVIAGVGKDERFVGTEAPVAALREALSHDVPYVVPDVAKADGSQLLVKLARENGAGSFLALALRHQGRVVGHLFCGAPEPYRFPVETVEAMRILASMAAAVLEQRRADALAAREARRLAAVIEHLPIAVEVFASASEGGRLLQGNAAARALRAVVGEAESAAAPFPGLALRELDGAALSLEALPPVQALAGAQPPPREVVLVRDGEALASLLLVAAPLHADDGGSVEAVVMACQDVTTLHALAQEKDRFLRVAAHELRSPVTALHATMQLTELEPRTVEDPVHRGLILGRLSRQATRLKGLVEQLLDSARLQAGDLPLQRAEIDLVSLCHSAIELAMPAGGPRATVVATAPVVGRWDPLRLEQVVTNLLSNAARYSPSTSEVTVDVRAEGGRALLSVIDGGIGIPADQLEQLFVPFFRAANAHAKYAGGLGLGLFIAQEIVRRHGGAIHVRSRENVGTTFTVELPLDAEAT